MASRRSMQRKAYRRRWKFHLPHPRTHPDTSLQPLNNHTMDFIPYPKTPRLNRDVMVTEKIDGTCSCIAIEALEGYPAEGAVWQQGGLAIYAGSRNRWITPAADNFGFARWVVEHAEELMQLGPGRYFGEWWGSGIQRTYGLKEKRLSLFNPAAFCLHGETPKNISKDPKTPKYQKVLPACVGIVPVLYRGPFTTEAVSTAIERLKTLGSVAAPGFMDPEGLIVFHEAGGHTYKVTVKDDDKRKSE